MAISSIEHRGYYYDIFDARGKKAKSVSDNIGELQGWSDRFFIVLKGYYYDTYDEQGKKSNQFQQTLAISFLSALINSLSERVFGLIHTMLLGRK